MPTSFIKKLSKEGKGSIPTLEKKWEKAKKLGKNKGYDYVMGIFKRMLRIK